MSKKLTVKKEPELSEASVWFDTFVEENKTEILIHKAMVEIACKIKMEREKNKLSQKKQSNI